MDSGSPSVRQDTFSAWKVRNRHGIVLDFVEFSVQGSGDQGTGERQFNAGSHAIRSARPAGVDQPDVYFVLLQFFAQQLRVGVG